MVNPRQVCEVHPDVFEQDGLELVWPWAPSELVGLGVCAHHRTYNIDLVKVNQTTSINWFPMPSFVLQSESDMMARSLFSLYLSRMGVILDDHLFHDLLSLSRAINDDRTGINAHTAIPVVVLVATVHHMHESITTTDQATTTHEAGDEFEWWVNLTDDDEAVNRAMEESVEEYVGLQMVPASQSSLDVLEKVMVDRSCSMDQCMICLEKFFVEELITRVPCSHVYHGNCIIQWLKTSHFCPLCRFEMST